MSETFLVVCDYGLGADVEEYFTKHGIAVKPDMAIRASGDVQKPKSWIELLNTTVEKVAEVLLTLLKEREFTVEITTDKDIAKIDKSNGIDQVEKTLTERRGFSIHIKSHFYPIGPHASNLQRAPARRTLTVAFTDIKGYSALMDQDEATTLKMLERHNAVVAPCILAHDGKLIKSTGDGYMIYFQSALDGVKCAFSIQEELTKLNREAMRIRVRIGINTGDALVSENGDLHGTAVNVAKRIEQEAQPGGICVSQSVFQNISPSERSQYSFQDAGKIPLKGSSEPVQCWHVFKSDQGAASQIHSTIPKIGDLHGGEARQPNPPDTLNHRGVFFRGLSRGPKGVDVSCAM